MRQRLCMLERAARFDESLDQADLQGLDRGYRAAGEDEVERSALTDHARQADRSHVDQRHAETPVEHAKRRVAGGDAKVAPERQLEPAGHGVALDRGDHRLAEDHPRGPHRSVGCLGRWVRRAGGESFQVEARTEMVTRTRQHGDRQPSILVESFEGRLQGRRSRRVDCISHLRPRDGDRHHAAIGRDLDLRT